MWSPKRKSNGARNSFYESMREVAPGDVVFSFVDTTIYAIGIAQSYSWSSPKPEEFGKSGQNWENVGWRVNVAFTPLKNRIRPKDHMGVLGPVLPSRLSPLQLNGDGLQAVYLAAIGEEFGKRLTGLIGPEAEVVLAVSSAVLAKPQDDLDLWDVKLEQKVIQDPTIPETEREAIVRARKGQGLFKSRVLKIESRCRITKVENPAHLVASHCKPWRDSSNQERLDGENGLLLTPSIDHLFDRGFIGFENDGRVIISPVADRVSLGKMGIDVAGVVNVGSFTLGQQHFLDYHRNAILLQSSIA